MNSKESLGDWNIWHAIAHLRFKFSFFLLPVFLFALSEVTHWDWLGALLAFFVLHFLVYPASNGYNSLMDADEGSIGGLKDPPKASGILFPITLTMDILALILIGLWSLTAFWVLLSYILASRLYSWRTSRIKRYPLWGYLLVVVFQGAAVYYFSLYMADLQPPALNNLPFSTNLGMLLSSLMIASSYPLTQIYQHEQDRQDGVTTISMLLGKRGTFFFAIVVLFVFTALLMVYLALFGRLYDIVFYLLVTAPATVHLFQWFRSVLEDEKHANFQNSMKMSWLGALGMNLFFIYLFFATQFF